MSSATSASSPAATQASPPEDRLGRIMLWLLLAVLIFDFPFYPTLALDPSWRMAYGWFFQQGLQAGRDVVFTYGPLGYLIGRTYSGLQFSSLVLWQLFTSVVFAGIIVANARSLRGLARGAYFLFFALFGVIIDGALDLIVIALLGWELVRRADGPAGRGTPLIALLLALLAMIKFTSFLLGGFVITVAAGYAWRQRRPRAALAPAVWFGGGFLGLWIACRQNPLNLPLYVINSLEVARGYDGAMALPSPPDPLWKAATAVVVLAVYGGLYLCFHPHKSQALAFAAILGAFVFLSWKQGFVRSDGHMMSFFVCALVPVIAFPELLGDGPRLRWLQRALLVFVGVLCVAGLHDVAPGFVRSAAGQLQNKIWNNVDRLVHWPAYRGSFDDRLREQQQMADLPLVRAAVGRATIDVLGFEQAVALLNSFNYHPRPVFQSYAAYTPRLARLNQDFYFSERAPKFVLFKVQTLDGRLPALDDSLLLNLLVHNYRYVLSEKRYQLWQRREPRPDPATLAPRLLRTITVAPNTPSSLDDLVGRPVWATVVLSPSPLGRLRSFLYKPAFVRFIIDETDGRTGEYKLPLLEGRTGFILSPMIADGAGYLRFAGGQPGAWVRSITVTVQKEDLRYFYGQASINLFALTPSTAGADHLAQAARERFWTFKTAPLSFRAFSQPGEAEIDGQKTIVMHAPSEMVFNVPQGATQVSGSFGYVRGAYEAGGRTDGAEFRVIWTNGNERAVIYARFLNPLDNPADRGLQTFQVSLKGRAGGQLRLEVDPGPKNDHSWDWTAWTNVEIK